MKALKKFYTEQELQDWPESEEFTVPNVCIYSGLPGVGYNYGYIPPDDLGPIEDPGIVMR